MPNLFLTDAETFQLKEIVQNVEVKAKDLLTKEHISLNLIHIKLQKLCLAINTRKAVKK